MALGTYSSAVAVFLIWLFWSCFAFGWYWCVEMCIRDRTMALQIESPMPMPLRVSTVDAAELGADGTASKIPDRRSGAIPVP